ncbi:MAG: sulfotransferase family 2 domain-containing protein [Pseudomonadota bacterium]
MASTTRRLSNRVSFTDVLVKNINFSGLGRVGETLRNRIYKRRIFFAHVPKCGGTSLSHALRIRYPLSYFKLSEEAASASSRDLTTGQWMELKARLVAYHAHCGRHFLQGHIPVTEDYIDRHLTEYNLMTLLRDPVDRVVSHYFFDPRLNKLTPEDFLRHQRGFIETHALCHFFGGLDWDNPGDVGEAEARAMTTLDRFDVVGILEEPAAFERTLREDLGLRLSIPHRNQGTTRAGRSLPPEIMERITEMCEADLRIYRRYRAHAVRRLEGQADSA